MQETSHLGHNLIVLLVPYVMETEQRVLWCKDCNQKVQILTEQEFNDYISNNH